MAADPAFPPAQQPFPPAPAVPPATQPFPPAPQADRHLLSLHELRHRQLRTAFLHGRRRSWRDRRRIWPAVVAAIVILALIVTAVAVLAAFQRQQILDASVGPSPTVVSPEPLPPNRIRPATR